MMILFYPGSNCKLNCGEELDMYNEIGLVVLRVVLFGTASSLFKVCFSTPRDYLIYLDYLLQWYEKLLY